MTERIQDSNWTLDENGVSRWTGPSTDVELLSASDSQARAWVSPNHELIELVDEDEAEGLSRTEEQDDNKANVQRVPRKFNVRKLGRVVANASGVAAVSFLAYDGSHLPWNWVGPVEYIPRAVEIAQQGLEMISSRF